MEELIDEKLQEMWDEGVGDNLEDLKCYDYTQEEIDEDDAAALEFEVAKDEVLDFYVEEQERDECEQEKVRIKTAEQVKEYYDRIFDEK